MIKRFKQQSDLIKCAVKRAIHRSILKAEVHAEKMANQLKENNWLEWAKQKARMPR